MPDRVRRVAVIVGNDAVRRALQRRLSRVEKLEVTESRSSIEEVLGRDGVAVDLFMLDRAALHAISGVTRSRVALRDALTPQELDVLRRIAMGLRTTDIALLLGRSPKTIEKHRSSLHRKLGLRSVAQLTAYAIQSRLLTLDQILIGRQID